jgi:hypothetical protein
MIAPGGTCGFGPLRFVRVISIKPSLICHVPANVLVSGRSFHMRKYEKVPSGAMIVVLVKVAVPCVFVPSCFQVPGIFLDSLASRLQPESSKLNAKNVSPNLITYALLPD